MVDHCGNSPSKYHLIISCKASNSVNIAFLSSISSIWEDDHIEKLEDNQWKCLWCDVKCQGINATKSLDHVIGDQMYEHTEIGSFSLSRLFINIQVVTENQS